MLRRFLALCALGVALSAAGRARAADNQDKMAEARKLYSEAKQAFKDHKYRDAALGFEAASKLHPAGVALYTAAQAWELAGDQTRAADAYARALSTPKLSDSQTERAKSRLDALEKNLGTVTIKGPATTTAQLEDRIELPLPAVLHGTPGDHTLTLKTQDGLSEQRKITLVAGQHKSVDAEAKTEAAPDETQPTGPTETKKPAALAPPAKHPVEVEKSGGSSTLETVGWVATGAGLAAVGGGVMLGLSAKDAAHTYDSTPSQATYDHAMGLESRTNIMLIAGGAVAAIGVGLVIWQKVKRHEHPEKSAQIGVTATPNGIWAEGSF